MAKFSLFGQLRLSAVNLTQVVSDIKKQLGRVNISVAIANYRDTINNIRNLKNATDEAADSGSKLGEAFGVSLKRFAAFSIASRAIGVFTAKLSRAFDEAVAFDRELIKLSQVTGKTTAELKPLTKEVERLATTYGVASKDILDVGVILAQAGLTANDTRIALEALAKTKVSATFGAIEDTAEGAVAILAQFGEGATQLERQLGAVNEVSAKFAVESEDLISAIRKTGGVFKASGGSLEELLGLFTSIRATTRESAETIATGLRTILTRIQRPKTIEQLKTLGVDLKDTEGRFVGAFEAFRRLNKVFGELPEGNLQFIRISEELGGFRQIGKVIPLLQQFELAERARQAAVKGGASLDKDAKVAQEALSIQFTKTREQFLALIRSLTTTESFKAFTSTALSLASSLIRVVDALKELIPFLSILAGIKLAQGVGGFFKSIGTGFSRVQVKNSGGEIRKFASGGIVPGTGNRDTVPAMLTPGEFVIRKSSVKKIGAENLQALNTGGAVRQKFATGGLAGLSKIADGGGKSKISTYINGYAGDGRLNPRDRVKNNVIRERISKQDIDNRGGISEFKRKIAIYSRKYPGDIKSKKGFAFEDWLKANIVPPGYKKTEGNYPVDFISPSGPPIEAKYKFNPEPDNKILSKHFRHLLESDGWQDLEFTTDIDKDKGRSAVDLGRIILYELEPRLKEQIEKRQKSTPDKDIAKRLGGIIPIKFANGGKAPSILDVKEIAALTLDKESKQDFKFIIDKESAPEFSELPEEQLKKFPKTYSAINAQISPRIKNQFSEALDFSIIKAVDEANRSLSGTLSGYGIDTADVPKEKAGSFLKGIAASAKGSLFEASLASMTRDFDPSSSVDAFDFIGPKKFDKIFDPTLENVVYKDAKLTASKDTNASIIKKTKRRIADEFGLKPEVTSNIQLLDVSRIPPNGITAKSAAEMRDLVVSYGMSKTAASKLFKQGDAGFLDTKQFFDKNLPDLEISTRDNPGKSAGQTWEIKRKNRENFATGGTPTGTDTVPALLTPGEFVVNKKSAQRIGYANLDRMNKQGVAKFATGGYVGPKRYATGTGPSGVTSNGDAGESIFKNRIVQLTLLLSGLSGVVDTLSSEGSALSKGFSALNTSAIGFAGVFALITQTGKIFAQNSPFSVIGKQTAELNKVNQELEANSKSLEDFRKSINESSTKAKESSESQLSSSRAKAEQRRQSQLSQIAQTRGPAIAQAVSERAKPIEKAESEFRSKFEKSSPKTRASIISFAQNLVTKVETEIQNELAKGSSASNRRIERLTALKEKGQFRLNVSQGVQVSKRNAAIARKNARFDEIVKNVQTSKDVGDLSKISSRSDAVIELLESKPSLNEKEKASLAERRTLKAAADKRIAEINVEKSTKKLEGTLKGLGAVIGAVAAASQLASSYLEYQATQTEKLVQSGDIAEVNQRFSGVTGLQNATFLSGLAGNVSQGGIAGASLGAVFGPLGALVGALAGGAGAAGLDLFFGQSKRAAEKTRSEAVVGAAGVAQDRALSSLQRTLASGGSISETEVGNAIARFSQGARVQTEELKTQRFTDRDREAAIDTQTDSAIKFAEIIAKTAVSTDDLSNKINALTDGTLANAKAVRDAANAAFKLRKANELLFEITSKNAKFFSSFDVANASLNNLIASFETGYSEAGRLNDSLADVVAIGSAGAFGENIINQARIQAENILGVGTKMSEAANEMFNNMMASNEFLTKLTEANIELPINDPNAVQTFKEQIRGLFPPSREVQTLVESILDNIDQVPSDMGAFINQLKDSLSPLGDAVRKVSAISANYEKVIIDLTKRRREAEENLIQAQMRSIDIQVEAAKNLESFGGDKFTSAQQFAAEVAKINTRSGRSGISLATGSSQEIIAASREIQKTFQKLSSGEGSFAGVAGLEADVRQDLLATEEQLLDLTRKKIEQINKEIELTRKKNELEKASVQKLLSGDIRGFVEQAQASIAANILRSGGDSRLLSGLSRSAVSAGLQNIEEAGANPLELQRAASAALRSSGVRNQRFAEVLSGTTAEEMALMSEGRRFSQAQSELASGMENMQAMNVRAAEVKIEAAKLQFEGNLSQQSQIVGMSGLVIPKNIIENAPAKVATAKEISSPAKFIDNVRNVAQNMQNVESVDKLNKMVTDMSKVLSSAFSGFAQSVEKLSSLQLSVKLDAANVNVNFNGAGFLAGLTDSIREEVVSAVQRELPKLKQNSTGQFYSNGSTLS